MPPSFRSTQVSVTDDGLLIVVAFTSEGESSENPYLIFQGQPKCNAQDIKLGHNQPHIEYCSQQWSWYGHIESLEVSRECLRLKLDCQAAEAMGNDGDISIGLAFSEREFSSALAALRRIFEQSGRYSVTGANHSLQARRP